MASQKKSFHKIKPCDPNKRGIVKQQISVNQMTWIFHALHKITKSSEGLEKMFLPFDSDFIKDTTR